MPSVRQLRGRIRGVRSTARVTRAMQMVAASKMRRAQDLALGARPYAEKLREVLARVAGEATTDSPHPLLEVRPVRHTLVLEVTPDRGLCGGLPSNLNRAVARFIVARETPTAVITIGRKGRDFMARTGVDLKASFDAFGDRPTLADVLPVSRMLESAYVDGEADEVHLAFTLFKNTMEQAPVVTRLLPVEPAALEAAAGSPDHLYEPDAAGVLAALLPRYLEMQVYHALLEANASEQSARMVAMRKATEAADDMIETLTLQMNKARQNAITAELLDIVGGVAALEG
ncbi:MAG: ATP synthase F1 subunit gamma [Chloroflexi bacterium]|nr:ATP synthase F1 subunit gamma [Chloroflexota bacterium]